MGQHFSVVEEATRLTEESVHTDVEAVKAQMMSRKKMAMPTIAFTREREREGERERERGRERERERERANQSDCRRDEGKAGQRKRIQYEACGAVRMQ